MIWVSVSNGRIKYHTINVGTHGGKYTKYSICFVIQYVLGILSVLQNSLNSASKVNLHQEGPLEEPCLILIHMIHMEFEKRTNVVGILANGGVSAENL